MSTKYLIPKNFNGSIVTVFSNGICDYSKLSPEDYFVKNNLDPNDYLLVNPGDFDIQFLQPFIAGKQLPWEEITEEKYFEWLEVLPPKRRHYLNESISIFFVSEAIYYSLHRACIFDGRTQKFYSAIRDISIPSPKLLENFLSQFPNS